MSKQIITILAITFSLFAFSTTAQAQTIELRNAPANFSKAKFKQLLHNKGLSQQEFNQIGGMNAVINSLHKVNGQWKFQISNYQKAKLTQFTNGNIQFHNTGTGGDGFTDIAVGGTII